MVVELSHCSKGEPHRDKLRNIGDIDRYLTMQNNGVYFKCLPKREVTHEYQTD